MLPQNDPYLKPTYPLSNRLRRSLWDLVYLLLFRPTPRPLHRWRALLLKCFGARLGPRCRINPKSRIWAPWNLICEDAVVIANDAEVYNQAMVHIGSHAIISQQAYICTATHDVQDRAFTLVAMPVRLGRLSWICARATVMPGVSVGNGAVLALGGVATKNLDPWMVYSGIPAKPLCARNNFEQSYFP